ncbi:hypothetical protein EW145_g6805 [Phellinidium pouzarii]|uniref:Uncharacterized protein n=1 Tax=Phellinidium pouzarii TaxID=167371 RepID=A0A4V3XBK1_9AGAM|nr:hypothetical protein EW145_g6805 [Phellinidium pouzarii]
MLPVLEQPRPRAGSKKLNVDRLLVPNSKPSCASPFSRYSPRSLSLPTPSPSPSQSSSSSSVSSFSNMLSVSPYTDIPGHNIRRRLQGLALGPIQRHCSTSLSLNSGFSSDAPALAASNAEFELDAQQMCAYTRIRTNAAPGLNQYEAFRLSKSRVIRVSVQIPSTVQSFSFGYMYGRR